MSSFIDDNLVAWDYITGTSDVPSEMHVHSDENGLQELLFNIKGEHTLRMPLNDFLLCWRLFNMTFYSRLLDTLNLCVNTECRQLPYGAHQRTPECPGRSPWQKKADDEHQAQMRELQRQEKLRLASIDSNDGN